MITYLKNFFYLDKYKNIMKNKDIIMLEELYELIVEDAQTTLNQAMNMLIQNKVGYEVFKYKNKPENKDKISKAKNELLPTLEKFANIIKEINPNDKNLSDIIPLVTFYIKNTNFSNTAIERLRDFYQQYMQYPSLVNQRMIAKVNSLTEFTAKIHEEESKKNKMEYSATLGKGDDPNKVYEDDQVIVFRATDPEDAEKSIENCKKYGKGSNLCISSGSDSNIMHHYLDYRLNHKLTTYFVWVKSEEGYLLVDAQDNGKFGWNDNPMGGYNTDHTDETEQEMIDMFPYLKGAFNADAFESLDIGHGEYKHKIEEFEKELQDIEDSYKDKLKHCSVHFDVNHDEGDYIYYYGSGAIKIDDIHLLKTIDINDPYDFRRVKDHTSSSIPYQFKENPQDFDDLVKLISDFRKYDTSGSANSMMDYMTGMYEGRDGTLYLNFDVAGDEGGSSTNTNDFDYLCQMMTGYEKDYSAIKKAFIKALMVNGFIEQNENMKQIDNEEEFISSLKNFEYDEEDPEIFELRTRLFRLTEEENNNLHDGYNMFTGNGNDKSNSQWMATRLYWLIYKNYKKQEPSGEQLNFKKFMESYYYEDPDLHNYDISGVKLKFQRYAKKDEGYLIEGILEIKIDYLTEDASKILKFLDDSAQDIENLIYYFGAKLCNKMDDKATNIKKLYAKYL